MSQDQAEQPKRNPLRFAYFFEKPSFISNGELICVMPSKIAKESVLRLVLGEMRACQTKWHWSGKVQAAFKSTIVLDEILSW